LEVRGLDTTGLKGVLQARYDDAIQEEKKSTKRKQADAGDQDNARRKLNRGCDNEGAGSNLGGVIVVASPSLSKQSTEDEMIEGHSIGSFGQDTPLTDIKPSPAGFGMHGAGIQSSSISPLPAFNQFGEAEEFSGQTNLDNSLELPPIPIKSAPLQDPKAYAELLMQEILCVPLALGSACEGTWGGVIEDGALDFGLWRNLICCDGHYFLREYEGYDEPNRKEFICRVIFIGPEKERKNYSVEMKFASKNVEFVWRGIPISFHTSDEELDRQDVESLILRPKAVHLLHADSSAVRGEDTDISDWFTITKTGI
jgi:hypothetical protein